MKRKQLDSISGSCIHSQHSALLDTQNKCRVRQKTISLKGKEDSDLVKEMVKVRNKNGKWRRKKREIENISTDVDNHFLICHCI